MNRSKLKPWLLAGALMAATVSPAVLGKTLVYVSNSIDGTITSYTLDESSGALAELGSVMAGKVVMPMAVAPNRRCLYAVVRSAPMRVFTYGIDGQSGALTQWAEAPLPDSMPYVATDRTGRFLLTASYSGNKVAVSPIDADCKVTRPASQILPTGRNAHAIQTDRSNRFVFVPNLGDDQILQFRFDAASGQLTPNDPPLIKTAAGEGPRHFVFSPDNHFVYVLHELSGMVTQYELDANNGRLQPVISVASVPADAGLVRGVVQPPITADRLAARTQEKPRNAISAADIKLTPDGRYLFTTERTSSKLALFQVDAPTGRPRFIESIPTVNQPRGIAIDPQGRFLVASGEKSTEVAVYRIESSTGRLTEVSRAPAGKGANWVEIVELP
ncbi:lactonase family protein [Pseudomonas oryzihabitans]|uniref:lactonase family protein n=1 Tax=Pseudomonas oryzihabitans TaxID=47885 RepID=UPI0011A0683D|nr:beta-propeller fold lactonase family protein [Pseudomonas psychrotolerans]